MTFAEKGSLALVLRRITSAAISGAFISAFLFAGFYALATMMWALPIINYVNGGTVVVLFGFAFSLVGAYSLAKISQRGKAFHENQV